MNKTEWFGEIPLSWNIYKIQNLFRNRNVKVSDKDYEPLSVTKSGIYPQLENVAKSNDSDNRKLVCAGDFVINSRSDRKQSCGVSPYDGSVSLINTVIYPFKNIIDMKYIGFLFDNYGFAEEFYKWGHGIVADLWTTRWQEMANIEIPVPSLFEQKKIHLELSEKTIKIDQLIANQQQQIEKLKEYKQSLISNVVTNGLNTNVEIKESGIKWIGNIPSKWNVIRIKDFTKLKGRIGWQGLTTSDYIEEGPLLITGTDFSNGSIDWTTCVHISEDRYSEAPEIHVNENDLLITKDGTVGKVAIVRNLKNKASLNSGVLLIRVLENFNFDKSFIYFVLQSDSFWVWYNSSQTGGSTIKHLYQNQFSYFSFAYPDIDEQIQISEYLYSRVAKIDKLIEVRNSKIDKLKDYKKSLIYEYVTGKKEVS